MLNADREEEQGAGTVGVGHILIEGREQASDHTYCDERQERG
jgi:hypothetical protein